jgi:hypothetical protein
MSTAPTLSHNDPSSFVQVGALSFVTAVLGRRKKGLFSGTAFAH